MASSVDFATLGAPLSLKDFMNTMFREIYSNQSNAVSSQSCKYRHLGLMNLSALPSLFARAMWVICVLFCNMWRSEQLLLHADTIIIIGILLIIALPHSVCFIIESIIMGYGLGILSMVALYYGQHVSTTHCIVGAMVEFGLVYGGSVAVFWSSLARVTSSWVISPFVGAAVSFLVYKCVEWFVYSASNPWQATAAAAPVDVFWEVISSSFMLFAQGGNDVSNAIGPLVAALSILHGVASGVEIVIPIDILAWGGFWIVARLLTWGYRVRAVIGKKITELTPTRGFAAKFVAA